MVIAARGTKIKPEYKLTEVGVIPEDWLPTPLEIISTFISKGTTPTTYGFSWTGDGILFLRSECVSEKGLDLTQSMFISPEAHNILKRGEVHSGDILITITGNVGRVIYLSNDFGIANINQHIARIRINNNNVAADYVFYFLSQPTIRKYYNSIITGQAYPQISLKQVRDTRIPIPPTLSEQQAIATALCDVDALIVSLDKLIAKKRDIKQATMQQLITGKMRLPGFRGEWKIKKLEDECELITKGTTPTSLGKFFASQGINFVKIESLTEEGNIIQAKLAFIDEETHNLLRRSQLKNNDILFSIAGALGRTAIVKQDILPANTNQALALIRLKDRSCLDHIFLAMYLSGPTITQYIKLINVQAAQANLSLENVRNFEIKVPAIAEQQAITSALSDMDAEIAALEQRRDKTHELKQGIMQELLTGKTRLI